MGPLELSQPFPVTEAQAEGVFRASLTWSQAPQDQFWQVEHPSPSPEPIWSILSFS